MISQSASSSRGRDCRQPNLLRKGLTSRSPIGRVGRPQTRLARRKGPMLTFSIKIYTEMFPGIQFTSYCLLEIWDYGGYYVGADTAGCVTRRLSAAAENAEKL